ncbi:MAG: type II toxin-antitoxin system VapC family toxin [Propylenella sp.]
MFLLDTNVISELRRPERADPQVVRWASSVAEPAQFLSSVTILELEVGALSLRRKDEVQGNALWTWIRHTVLAQFADRILPFSVETSLLCAPLHVPDRRPQRDAMIAATAIEHRMTVVTRNVRDFAAMGVPLLNPWTQ